VTRGVEEEAKRQLERTQAQLLGMVVTKITPEHDDGYYFYEKYTRPATHQGGPDASGRIGAAAISG
jgi:hypothetical protein